MDQVTIGRDLDTGELISIPQEERRLGTYIIGENGTGKTTLVANLVVQDMQQGYGIVVLDPHADLVEYLLHHIPSHRESDVVLLDVQDFEHPFGLNLYEPDRDNDPRAHARVASQTVAIFEASWGESSWGPRLERLLRSLGYLLAENPEYTMVEIPEILVNSTLRHQLVARCTNRTVIDFFTNEYDRIPARDLENYFESTVNKIDGYISHPFLYTVLGQAKSTIHWREFMDQGKIVLVSLAAQGDDFVTNLLGATIVSQLLNAAYSRQDVPERARRQFNVYADEFERFATRDFNDLLVQARKYGIATTLSHQARSQIGYQAKGATGQTAHKIVFRVSGVDAIELASEFNTDPEPGEPRRELKTEPVVEEQSRSWWDAPAYEEREKTLRREQGPMSNIAKILALQLHLPDRGPYYSVRELGRDVAAKRYDVLQLPWMVYDIRNHTPIKPKHFEERDQEAAYGILQQEVAKLGANPDSYVVEQWLQSYAAQFDARLRELETLVKQNRDQHWHVEKRDLPWGDGH